MPATTPVLALPYPVAADTADIPRDIQALAVKLDGAPSPVVTALPGSPANGQIVTYWSATLKLAWQLIYVAAADPPSRWRVIGGGPWMATTQTGFTMTAAMTAGQAFTAPLAGVYDLTIDADMVGRPVAPTGVGAYQWQTSPGAVLVPNTYGDTWTDGQDHGAHGRSFARATLAAGAVIAEAYASNPAGIQVTRRSTTVMPVWVG